jgi:hypothetical protein
LVPIDLSLEVAKMMEEVVIDLSFEAPKDKVN